MSPSASFWQWRRFAFRTDGAARSGVGRRWWADAGLALARRPDLWTTALRQALRLSPSGWWRRWPPLPRPDADYLRFRMETAYGDPDHEPEPADVVAYLTWCQQDRRNRPPRARRRG